MLGRALGLPTGYPCAAGLGATSLGGVGAEALGNWRAPSHDLEAEVLTIRTSVEAVQTGLTHLENKLTKNLEHVCARQVDDVLAGSNPLQDVRQTVNKLEVDCRQLRVEVGRMPLARDVDEALQQHKAAIESRVGDRIEALEKSISKQHYSAMEQLESRGGETWRACLQRMSDLETKTVLQAEVPRIVERVLADIRKAGPDLFGPGAVLGPSALAEVRSQLRRLEAKVAGCEARLLGLSEDVSADGRVWRASIAAKVEALEAAHHGVHGRVSGCEMEHKAHQETVAQRIERLEAENEQLREAAGQAHDMAKTAGSEALERAEKLLEEQARDLRNLTHGHVDELQSRIKGLEELTDIHKQDALVLKQATETLTKWRSSVVDGVAKLTTDIAQLEARTGAQVEANRQAAETVMGRVEHDLHQLEARVGSTSGTLEAQVAQLRSANASFERRLTGSERQSQTLANTVTRMEATHRALEQVAARSAVTLHQGYSHLSPQPSGVAHSTPCHSPQPVVTRGPVAPTPMQGDSSRLPPPLQCLSPRPVIERLPAAQAGPAASTTAPPPLGPAASTSLPAANTSAACATTHAEILSRSPPPPSSVAKASPPPTLDTSAGPPAGFTGRVRFTDLAISEEESPGPLPRAAAAASSTAPATLHSMGEIEATADASTIRASGVGASTLEASGHWSDTAEVRYQASSMMSPGEVIEQSTLATSLHPGSPSEVQPLQRASPRPTVPETSPGVQSAAPPGAGESRAPSRTWSDWDAPQGASLLPEAGAGNAPPASAQSDTQIGAYMPSALATGSQSTSAPVPSSSPLPSRAAQVLAELGLDDSAPPSEAGTGDGTALSPEAVTQPAVAASPPPTGARVPVAQQPQAEEALLPAPPQPAHFALSPQSRHEDASMADANNSWDASGSFDHGAVTGAAAAAAAVSAAAATSPMAAASGRFSVVTAGSALLESVQASSPVSAASPSAAAAGAASPSPPVGIAPAGVSASTPSVGIAPPASAGIAPPASVGIAPPPGGGRSPQAAAAAADHLEASANSWDASMSQSHDVPESGVVAPKAGSLPSPPAASAAASAPAPEVSAASLAPAAQQSPPSAAKAAAQSPPAARTSPPAASPAAKPGLRASSKPQSRVQMDMGDFGFSDDDADVAQASANSWDDDPDPELP
mmetsp:Transcript_31477/g.73539  ORF Transcript_31477/g.73539 Transcript_31477/m.73539 type:complete len:1164 (+) Transcript_31477:95-3586(+)